MPQPMLAPSAAFLIRHAGIGFGLATLFLAALLWADPGGVGRVLLDTPAHPWPMLLLWVFCGLTLGAAQIGIALMLEDGPPDDRGGGGGRRDALLAPIPVRVTRRR